jgi:hypothetical protein
MSGASQKFYALTRMKQFRYSAPAIVDLSINACKGKPVERRGRKASGLRDVPIRQQSSASGAAR